MKAVKLNIEGIKCDNPNCDYRDDSVKYKDYKNWLNKPCPKCGANLLTEKDLNAIKMLILIINRINWFLKPFIKPNKNEEKIVLHVEMNGTGKMNFRPKN